MNSVPLNPLYQSFLTNEDGLGTRLPKLSKYNFAS
jgi:hypothetical protein